MAKVNMVRVIANSGHDISVNSPLFEALVNSIHSIEDSERKDGVISVTFTREKQARLKLKDEEGGESKIVSFKVSDNGIGFNDFNLESFNVLYSDAKIKRGGKGFGRVSYLKHFKKVKISSVYRQGKQIYSRGFVFDAKEGDMVKELSKAEALKNTEFETSLTFEGASEIFRNNFDVRLDTIARKTLEHLLVYFIDDSYNIPRVIFKEADGSGELVLNDFLDKSQDIVELERSEFELTKKETKEKFFIKIFKVFYSRKRSRISLVAHNRKVSETLLHEYIPEFDDEYYEEVVDDDEEAQKRYYSVKCYVGGQYLDKNVSLERGHFIFEHPLKNKGEGNLFYPFLRSQIEEKAASMTAMHFDLDVKHRAELKRSRVQRYVDEHAPWYKTILNELDISSLPYAADESVIEACLHEAYTKKVRKTKEDVASILDSKIQVADEKVTRVMGEITELNRQDLARYVVFRKVILDLFKKAMETDGDGKYELEKVVHDAIYPMQKDSETVDYDNQNLWLIDERLSFNEYLISDKSLHGDPSRPDILIFENPVVVREGDATSNPITIFEFKRPQREEYTDAEDPIKQMGIYVARIRENKVKSPKGRELHVSPNTPAYCFLICDITPKIKEFCNDNQLVRGPDNQGYFGYHTGYKMYVQVISYEKLVADADMRNKIFFRKLGLA